MPKKGVRRRWYLDSQGIRRLGTRESGFHYVDAGGEGVTDERTLARIRKLRIPPAWAEVLIARGESAPLQAVGKDSKGRVQYRYHDKFRQQRDLEKFIRLASFAESLPPLRRRVERDLKSRELSRERVLAALVRLIDQGFFRVGNDKSAKSEETYGLTTVLAKHVKVSGDTIRFEFIGKWKKLQRRAIVDKELASLIRSMKNLEGEELFKFRDGSRVVDVKDRHVNQYLQSVIGNDFTAKDFRTWAGTLICSVALSHLGEADTLRKKKSNVKKAIDATAQSLGNTPAVCKKSYICPALLDGYIEGRPMITPRKRLEVTPVAKRGLSREEKEMLKFLRETIADRRRTPRAA
jgi:DNA topoisomerase I